MKCEICIKIMKIMSDNEPKTMGRIKRELKFENKCRRINKHLDILKRSGILSYRNENSLRMWYKNGNQVKV